MSAIRLGDASADRVTPTAAPLPLFSRDECGESGRFGVRFDQPDRCSAGLAEEDARRFAEARGLAVEHPGVQAYRQRQQDMYVFAGHVRPLVQFKLGLKGPQRALAMTLASKLLAVYRRSGPEERTREMVWAAAGFSRGALEPELCQRVLVEVYALLVPEAGEEAPAALERAFSNRLERMMYGLEG